MSDATLTISYALAKQVPAMERDFTIETNYGPIQFEGEEARSVITSVRKLLELKLKAAEKREAAQQGKTS